MKTQPEKLKKFSESHCALRPGAATTALASLCFLGVVGKSLPNGYFKQLAFWFAWQP